MAARPLLTAHGRTLSLQSNVDLSMIRSWLGFMLRIETPPATLYGIEIDLEAVKRKNASVMLSKLPAWQACES